MLQYFGDSKNSEVTSMVEGLFSRLVPNVWIRFVMAGSIRGQGAKHCRAPGVGVLGLQDYHRALQSSQQSLDRKHHQLGDIGIT